MRSRRWVESALRRGLFLVVPVILQRYLSPLVPIWSIVGWYAFGVATSVVAGRLTPTRGKHLLTLSAAYVGAVGIAYGSAIGLAFAVGPKWVGAMTSIVALLPYTVLLPAIGSCIVVAIDAIAGYNDRIASLVGPGVILLIVPIFWSQGFYRLELFDHAVWYVATAAIVTVLVVAHQRIVSNRVARVEPRSGRSTIIAIVLAVLFVVAGVGYHLWSVGATAAGGGLLRPDVFHFDFSDYIRLESKISMSRDLVLLYREDNMPADRLLRRYVLSGYDPRRGFFRRDDDAEPSSVTPPSLGTAIETINGTVPNSERIVTQEYYLLNLDPDALITVPTARRIDVIPQWEGSSFLGSYRVSSERPPLGEAFLRNAPWPDSIDPQWREAYVGVDIPSAIASLTEEITEGHDSLYGSIVAIEEYLREEYYYSLTPGVAIDGDQLGHFLFESKKGYCSYFAFSMALMVRSLGVPARVSLGFFVDPTSSMIGFYPVRADMAHAWVEVWFPGAGWIEFDPTSQRIAPGEDITFDRGADFERLGSLVEEILQRRELPDAEYVPQRTGSETDTSGRANATGAVLLALLLAIAGTATFRQWRWNRKVRLHPRGATEDLYSRATRYARRRAWVDGILTTGRGAGGVPDAQGGLPHRAARPRIASAESPPPPQRSAASNRVVVRQHPAGAESPPPPPPPQRSAPPLNRIGVYVDRGRYAAAYGAEDAIAAHRVFLTVFAGPATLDRPRSPADAADELDRDGSSLPSRSDNIPRWLRPLHRVFFFVLVTVPSRLPRLARSPGASRSRPAGIRKRVHPRDRSRTQRNGSHQRRGGPPVAVWFAFALACTAMHPAHAQEDLIDTIDAAIEGGNYSVALERLIEGQTRFPDDYRFFKRAGDLYYREGVFDLARKAWEEALDAGAPQYPVRYDISRAYARLNINQPAIKILTDLNAAVPEDLLVADDLAWLYYKENQLDAAQEILERTVTEFGRDRDLSMTLATVYAGQFAYERAVGEYEWAISDARRTDDSYFLAVAYYNISILHARFHRWSKAMDAAQRSLEMVERSSGFLIRAELEHQRLNLSRFKADVERAVALEDTGTLATLSLADAYVQLGDPDRAIAIVKDVIDSTHEGWLYYYGTDPERYLQQLYATAADAWEAGANRDAVHRPGTLRDRISIAVRGMARRVRQWYYRGLYRRQSVRVARSFAAGERPILAAWHRMRGSEWFSPLAIRHLAAAEEEELSVNPAAAIDYELTWAELQRDSERFDRLLPQLSDEWHRTDRLHALHGIYRFDGRRSPRGLSAAADAWRLHPNSFFIRGRSIPLRIDSSSKVRRTFRRLGVRHTEGSPLHLTYENRANQIVWTLSDTRTGDVLRRGRVASTVNPAEVVPVIVSQIATVQ